MKNGIRKGLSLLLSVLLTLSLFALPAAAGADASGDIGGTTREAVTFTVSVSGYGGGYLMLAGTRGTATVADLDRSGRITGTRSEADYGFFRIRVTKSGYDQAYVWAPSATQNTYGVQMAQNMVVALPYTGDYTVSVTPLTAEEINGTYWPQSRFRYWETDAAWVVSRWASNCTLSGGTTPAAPSSAARYQVTVNCLEPDGTLIRSYFEPVAYSKNIYPRAVSGYTAAASSGIYITCTAGVCSPASVSFYYTRNQAAATVTVYCYDAARNYIETYTETLASSKTIYPKEIPGYAAVSSSGQYISVQNGTCSPASVFFYYMKEASSGTVTVSCRDENGVLLRQYTETLTAGKTLYPPQIDGYDVQSSAQYVSFSHGACSPSSVSFLYQKSRPAEPVAASLTVNCLDESGIVLQSYTVPLTASQTVSPRTISGYEAVSSSQYVYWLNGACSPSTISFIYRKERPAEPVAAVLSVNCYDEAGTLLQSYTETLTASRTVSPRALSGYEAVTSGQYVTYNNGVCSPSTISFVYKKPPQPATLTIRCIDNNGNVIRSYTESLTTNKTFSPPSISGYTSLSGSQQVTYSNGSCSPDRVDFMYQIGSRVTPGSNPRMVYPTSWDTQFKPGTATHQNGTNAKRYDKFSYVYDDKFNTTYFWVIYQVELQDNIPEFTAYFDGTAEFSSIGIRNGNLAGDQYTYTKYGRVKRFQVRIYDKDGNETRADINLPDRYTTDYQEFPLGTVCTNVSRVEFWIPSTQDYYYGKDENMNVAHLADIAFFK